MLIGKLTSGRHSAFVPDNFIGRVSILTNGRFSCWPGVVITDKKEILRVASYIYKTIFLRSRL